MLKFHYCFDRQSLVRVDQVKDLNFLYVSSLDFLSHTDLIACKALHVIRFVMRHSSNFDTHECISSLYNALVRLLLEYGSVVWVPLYKERLDKA